ncbi:uncharacterized protein LOC119381980 [Rhipicephalus sanguineus]|uniref:uncharacterized protein LOC119381980 n=1 Tax=Rhipicephalus sanguineus TaxID=34632 RepID=UPI001895B220|nr:uncharacterized protein LOC119381980 [Rhipicephalus sanguineus]
MAFAGTIIVTGRVQTTFASLVPTVATTGWYNTAVPGPRHSRPFHVTDRRTKVRCLVDTSADICVLPSTLAERRQPPDSHPLTAVNGSTVRTYGQKSVTLDIGLRRTFHWLFVITHVSQPIMGADFRWHYKLVVDLGHSRILHSQTSLAILGVCCVNAEFPDVFRPPSFQPSAAHRVAHHIVTKDPPVLAWARRLAPDRIAVAKTEF